MVAPFHVSLLKVASMSLAHELQIMFGLLRWSCDLLKLKIEKPMLMGLEPNLLVMRLWLSLLMILQVQNVSSASVLL